MSEVVAKKERNINIDIIKTLAVLAVPAVHYFLYNGFLNSDITDSNMLLQVVIRQALLFCVPLFIITTGFLMSRKTLSRQYYRGLVYVLFVYVVTSIIYQLFNRFVMGVDVSILQIFKNIITFHGSQYCWYVAMYIGLFLLIPFLNIIWAGLKNQKQKIALCLTLLLISFLPTVLKSTEFGFWDHLYPITYYFIGAYLREFNFKMLKRQKIFLILVTLALIVALTLSSAARNDGMHTALFDTWDHPLIFAYATLIFSLLLDLNTKRIPNSLSRIFVRISSLTLGIYLISAIFDKLFYNKLFAINDGSAPLQFYFIVPVVMVLSVVVAMAIDYVYRFLRIEQRNSD